MTWRTRSLALPRLLLAVGRNFAAAQSCFANMTMVRGSLSFTRRPLAVFSGGFCENSVMNEALVWACGTRTSLTEMQRRRSSPRVPSTYLTAGCLINTTAITLTKVSGSFLLGRVVLMFDVLLSCFVVEHTRFVEGLFAFFIIRTPQWVVEVWEVLAHCVFMVHASAYPAHIAHEFSSRSSESSR